MERSYDPEVMRHALAMLPDDNSDLDYDAWVADTRNVMLVEGDNIGMAALEYPGLYTVHWFYTVRGRQAIKLAREMIAVMFTEHDAQTLRGITPDEYKAARWLAKQVGFTSYGHLNMGGDVPHEIQCITRQEFYNQNGITNGS